MLLFICVAIITVLSATPAFQTFLQSQITTVDIVLFISAIAIYLLMFMLGVRGATVLIREFAKPDSERFMDNPYLERKYRVKEQ